MRALCCTAVCAAKRSHSGNRASCDHGSATSQVFVPPQNFSFIMNRQTHKTLISHPQPCCFWTLVKQTDPAVPGWAGPCARILGICTSHRAGYSERVSPGQMQLHYVCLSQREMQRSSGWSGWNRQDQKWNECGAISNASHHGGVVNTTAWGQCSSQPTGSGFRMWPLEQKQL